MKYPLSAKPRVKLDALTGIKSSLSKLRSIISLAYLLYVVNDRRPSIVYGVSDGTKIKVDPSLMSKISEYLEKESIDGLVNRNPLVECQYEPLYVGVTLLLKLGNITMPGRRNTIERTGGNRYPKQLDFANNMILFDLIMQGEDEKGRKGFLWEWLQNRASENKSLEERVKLFITTCTTFTQFKIRDDKGKEIFFQTEGIYDAALEDKEGVLFLDSHEFVGPTRIYNNILKENLEPCFILNEGVVKINSDSDITCESIGKILSNTLDIYNVKDDSIKYEFSDSDEDELFDGKERDSVSSSEQLGVMLALRTKPFMLLAGISGTGKSRLVRELAFKSCPEYLQDADGTTPGNYCMIEVKPNWHDSTELLGYYSRLGKGGYQFTKFVKFLVKAKMFPDVPFFVCLDEMNLAPVEQYFAEILSILETRKHPKGSSDTIKTEVIIDAHYFKELERSIKGEYVGTDGDSAELIPDRDIYMKLYGVADVSGIRSEVGDRHDLTTEGLTLPDNVLIIGTVNMDDTTHQFSRKVIDRAMTIEMNGGRLADMYGGSKDLEYLEGPEQEKWQKAFKHLYVTADEVIEKHPEIEKDVWEKLPERLEAINNELKGTPFTVSYRVLNELTIMVGVLLDEKGSETNIDDIINQAVDYILLMKILPRIEGDREMFAIKDSKDTKLSRLLDIAPQIDFAVGEKSRPTAKDKIKEMIDRLDSQEFTRFWP